MGWNLFLDDERDPPRDSRDWVVARSFTDAVAEVINRGFPSYISFDHDLGPDSKDGYEFLKVLIEKDERGHSGYQFDDMFEFYVHSQNPVGKKNIEALLTRYLQIKRDAIEFAARGQV